MVFLTVIYVWVVGLLLVDIPLDNQGGVTFESEQVAYLYKHYDIATSTPVDTLRGTGSDTSLTLLYPAPSEVPGVLAVQIEGRKHIRNVGLHLFSAEELVAFDPVSRFLERYMLTVYAQGVSPEMNLSLLTSQRMSIQINGYTLGTLDDVTNDVRVVLPYLLNDRTCGLDWRSYTYVFSCETVEGDHLNIRVPARAELLLGQDKNELQQTMGYDVARYSSAAISSAACVSVPATSSLVTHRKGILRTEGRSLYPGIRSEIYFQQGGWKNETNLFRDPSEWLEYLNNLFLCPPLDLPVRVHVEHKVYGVDDATFEVPLNQLLSFFEAEGFDSYVGFERNREGDIIGTAVFKHQTFDYNHLLVIHDLDRLLSSKRATSVLDADLYTFIRNDNVQFLYGEYVDRKGKKIPVAINQE